jgi:hypothetical protein
MKVLKATLAQKKALEGTYNNGAILQFIQDKNNNWVVNDSVLFDEDFVEIKEQLEALPQIDFEPKPTPTI